MRTQTNVNIVAKGLTFRNHFGSMWKRCRCDKPLRIVAKFFAIESFHPKAFRSIRDL